MQDDSNNPSNKSSTLNSNGGAKTFSQTGSQIMQSSGKASDQAQSRD
jgi:hypothetical protein